MTFLFVDTNVLLHYRRLEETDWLSLSKCKEVVIVLCPAVIRELDQHKVNHSQNKFRKRAQEIIASLSRFSAMDSALIRDGVRLEFLSKDPNIDFLAHNLRSELSDDWIIASILEWRLKYPSDEIKIVSADLGVSIKARAQGIPTLSPLDADKLADELDAAEKQIKDLRKELAEIKNSLPQLKLCFWNQSADKQFLRFVISPPTAFDSTKGKIALLQIRSDYPMHQLPDEAQKHVEMKKMEKEFRRGNMHVRFPVSRSQIQRYNTELEAFYQAYETYLHKLHDFQNAKRRMITIEVGLQNSGSIPAEDIDVHMHFPDGFQLFDGDEPLPTGAKPPEPPRKPGTVGGFDMSGLQRLGHLTPQRAVPPPSNISSPSIRRTNSYDVRFQIKKAKHGFALRVAKFVAFFDNDESLTSFKVDYSVSAANLPKAVDDHLSIIIEKSLLSSSHPPTPLQNPRSL